MGKEVRKCNLYCPHFSDVLVESLCNYKQKENVAIGADCMYDLEEVSEERKKKVNSELEKELEFRKLFGESLGRVEGPHNIRSDFCLK